MTTYKARCIQMIKDVVRFGDFSYTESDDKEIIRSYYIGSFMTLDPCGKYHHMISPNGITARCERFWNTLDAVASCFQGWIETGEGDPTDIYFCKKEQSCLPVKKL